MPYETYVNYSTYRSYMDALFPLPLEPMSTDDLTQMMFSLLEKSPNDAKINEAVYLTMAYLYSQDKINAYLMEQISTKLSNIGLYTMDYALRVVPYDILLKHSILPHSQQLQGDDKLKDIHVIMHAETLISLGYTVPLTPDQREYANELIGRTLDNYLNTTVLPVQDAYLLTSLALTSQMKEPFMELMFQHNFSAMSPYCLIDFPQYNELIKQTLCNYSLCSDLKTLQNIRTSVLPALEKIEKTWTPPCDNKENQTLWMTFMRQQIQQLYSIFDNELNARAVVLTQQELQLSTLIQSPINIEFITPSLTLATNTNFMPQFLNTMRDYANTYGSYVVSSYIDDVIKKINNGHLSVADNIKESCVQALKNFQDELEHQGNGDKDVGNDNIGDGDIGDDDSCL